MSQERQALDMQSNRHVDSICTSADPIFPKIHIEYS